MSQPRYALYYAPPAGSALEQFGAEWLGRRVDDGQAVPQPRLVGIPPSQLETITAEPRKYGFHGTLKPPFALADGTDRDQLIAAIKDFCAGQQPFALPGWRLKWFGGFAALVPSAPCPHLEALAATCVERFDRFRAPSSVTDLERRRAKGLTARQDALLTRWGYPYVFEEFRFHLTLTGPIEDAAQKQLIHAALDARTAPLCAEPVPPLGELCLYGQPTRDAAFTLIDRFAFAGIR